MTLDVLGSLPVPLYKYKYIYHFFALLDKWSVGQGVTQGRPGWAGYEGIGYMVYIAYIGREGTCVCVSHRFIQEIGTVIYVRSGAMCGAIMCGCVG